MHLEGVHFPHGASLTHTHASQLSATAVDADADDSADDNSGRFAYAAASNARCWRVAGSRKWVSIAER